MAAKPVITRDEWERKLEGVDVTKQDLNRLIMNYLVVEGYKDAAEQFAAETGVRPAGDLASIQGRMDVRHAVQEGRIVDAIELVNDINPEILDTNASLYFRLQQQRLIELVRQGHTDAALSFAQEELAPRGEEHPQLLDELERTVALLAFADQTPGVLAPLLDMAQRQRLASELNAAILASQAQEKDPKLPGLLRMLLWAQTLLDEKVRYPRITNLVTAEGDTPAAEAAPVAGSAGRTQTPSASRSSP